MRVGRRRRRRLPPLSPRHLGRGRRRRRRDRPGVRAWPSRRRRRVEKITGRPDRAPPKKERLQQPAWQEPGRGGGEDGARGRRRRRRRTSSAKPHCMLGRLRRPVRVCQRASERARRRRPQAGRGRGISPNGTVRRRRGRWLGWKMNRYVPTTTTKWVKSLAHFSSRRQVRRLVALPGSHLPLDSPLVGPSARGLSQSVAVRADGRADKVRSP